MGMFGVGQDYKYPKGDFTMPISAGPYESGFNYNYEVLIPNHPLF
jgi:hypothetical protein